MRAENVKSLAEHDTLEVAVAPEARSTKVKVSASKLGASAQSGPRMGLLPSSVTAPLTVTVSMSNETSLTEPVTSNASSATNAPAGKFERPATYGDTATFHVPDGSSVSNRKSSAEQRTLLTTNAPVSRSKNVSVTISAFGEPMKSGPTRGVPPLSITLPVTGNVSTPGASPSAPSVGAPTEYKQPTVPSDENQAQTRKGASRSNMRTSLA